MRKSLIQKLKAKIEKQLRHFLREEGITLNVCANDNYPPGEADMLARISDTPIEGSELLHEIRVSLKFMRHPWQCDALVESLYQLLHPHHINVPELNVLLMSLHIDTGGALRPSPIRKRAVMRYIVEHQ